MAAGIVPMAVEFIDHGVIRSAEISLNRTWPATGGAASLIFILDGDTEEELLGRAERIAEVTEEAGAVDVLAASTKEQQENVLRIRSMVYEALRPVTAELLDVCVPRAEIAGHVEAVGKLADRFDVPLPTYGHAADGNVHTHILHHRIEDGRMGDPIPNWRDLHQRIRAAIYEDAVNRGGVISGEHGIGIVKREDLARYADPMLLELMRGAKTLFDPRGILNPAKIFA
jgi:glycolate oxidase